MAQDALIEGTQLMNSSPEAAMKCFDLVIQRCPSYAEVEHSKPSSKTSPEPQPCCLPHAGPQTRTLAA
jgi:hypothetical protein